MEVINLLHLSSRSELRQWLEENHNEEKCCWVVTYRGKRLEWPAIPYIEVVEEALCFGWIDSTLKRLPDGRLAQRLSPRRPKSHWTQLNIDRCIDLENRGLMTEAGRQAVEKAFEYEIVSPDSKISKRMREENKLKRPGMYE
ncbi:MAG: hypothetical protein IJE43_22845 [Alphaproteobacteria bacterium]|nr:hypothetical protein [Alphaproteobacteria bacterium]